MKRIAIEITQVVSGVLFLTGGLALILVYGKYADSRALIGLLLMGGGALIFTFYARGLVIRRG